MRLRSPISFAMKLKAPIGSRCLKTSIISGSFVRSWILLSHVVGMGKLKGKLTHYILCLGGFLIAQSYTCLLRSEIHGVQRGIILSKYVLDCSFNILYSFSDEF